MFSFDKDLSGFHNMRFQRNLALLFTLVLVILLGMSLNANNDVAEAFATQPAFLLRLDPKTGLTEVTQSVHSPSMEVAEEDLYIENALMLYVVHRERYYAHTFKYDQKMVNVYSEGQALETYRATIDPKNQSSLAANLETNGFAHVTVKNISKLKAREYQISWRLTVYKNPRAVPQHFDVRTILRIKHFGDTSIPKKKKDRYLNPFGMKVEKYVNQRETI